MEKCSPGGESDPVVEGVKGVKGTQEVKRMRTFAPTMASTSPSKHPVLGTIDEGEVVAMVAVGRIDGAVLAGIAQRSFSLENGLDAEQIIRKLLAKGIYVAGRRITLAWKEGRLHIMVDSTKTLLYCMSTATVEDVARGFVLLEKLCQHVESATSKLVGTHASRDASAMSVVLEPMMRELVEQYASATGKGGNPGESVRATREISVLSPAGNVICSVAAPGAMCTLGADLKKSIYAATGTLPDLQRLLLGTTVLEDSSGVPNGTTSVTLIVRQSMLRNIEGGPIALLALGRIADAAVLAGIAQQLFKMNGGDHAEVVFKKLLSAASSKLNASQQRGLVWNDGNIFIQVDSKKMLLYCIATVNKGDSVQAYSLLRKLCEHVESSVLTEEGSVASLEPGGLNEDLESMMQALLPEYSV